MSPRSSEKHIIFEKLRMYHAVCMVVWRVPTWGAGEKSISWLQKRSPKRYTRKNVLKKSNGFAWEVRTSMSPRSNEIATFFEKLQMSLAFSMVLRHLKARKKVCLIADTRNNL